MLFSAISFGVDGVLWALDVLGRIWFTTGVTMETPTGDGKWWEVYSFKTHKYDKKKLYFRNMKSLLNTLMIFILLNAGSSQ